MTEFSKTVLDRMQVRKSRAERAAFRDWLAEVSDTLGYHSHEEKGTLGARNVVVGDPATARVIYTAHYDTCARMPFPNFITPTNIWIYLLYQLLIVAGFFLVAGVIVGIIAAASVLLGASDALVDGLSFFGFYAALLAAMYLLLAGPANKHTANDNTSGVITLIEIMAALPQSARGDVAFIFFDLEEAGMFGSSAYFGAHKQEVKDTLIVNFDCVSDGNTILFAVKKKAARHAAALEAAFPAGGSFDVRVMTKGTFYPSDQAQFPLGVGVAALKKTKRGLLYMDRIHTDRDTVFEEANIVFLSEGAVRLAALLSQGE